MSHPNAALIRELYEAYTKGDMPTVIDQLCDDVVMHVPGRSPIAGEYQGPDGFLHFMAKNVQLAGLGLHIDLEDVLADDEHAVTFEHITAHRDGKTLDVHDNTVFRFRDGKIVEMTLLSGDPYAHDEFWS